jgi:hypothetical protein
VQTESSDPSSLSRSPSRDSGDISDVGPVDANDEEEDGIQLMRRRLLKEKK